MDDNGNSAATLIAFCVVGCRLLLVAVMFVSVPDAKSLVVCSVNVNCVPALVNSKSPVLLVTGGVAVFGAYVYGLVVVVATVPESVPCPNVVGV